MSFRKASITLAIMGTLITVGCTSESQAPQYRYETNIKPILQKYCYECHLQSGEGYEKSGFLMDNYEDLMKGTRFGAVITPGSSISSTLYLLVAGKADPSIRMPHGKQPMSKEDVETISRWIDQGAKK